MDDFGFQPDQIDPVVQKQRDVESLPYLKAEREVTPTDKRASVDREIVRRSKAAGVDYDFGFTPDSAVSTPATTPAVVAPQAALAPGQSAGAPSNANASTDGTSPGPALNAAAYGAAKGVTAGTFDYLPAAMATGVSKLPGGSNLSFKEALAAVRARRADQEAAHPVASTVGNVAGSIYTGARALPALAEAALPAGVVAAGGGVPMLAAQQGLQSGVQTYAGSPDSTLADAGKAAAVGAGTAGVLGTGANAVAAVSNKIASTQIVKQINTLLKDKPDGWKDTLEKVFGLGSKQGNVQAAKDMSTSLKEGGQSTSIQTPAYGSGAKGVNVGDVPNLSGAAGDALKTSLGDHVANIVSSTGTGLGTGLLAGGTTAGYNVITGKPVMDNVYQNVAGGTLAGLAGATAAAKGHILSDMTTRALTSPTVQAVAPKVLPTILSAAQPGVQPLIDVASGNEKFDHSTFVPDKEDAIKYDDKTDPKATTVLGKKNPYAGMTPDEVNSKFGNNEKAYLKAWKADKNLRDWELENEIATRKKNDSQ